MDGVTLADSKVAQTEIEVALKEARKLIYEMTSEVFNFYLKQQYSFFS